MSRVSLVLLVALSFALASRSAHAGEEAPRAAEATPPTADVSRLSYQLETGVASTYVFRGRFQYAARGDASSQSTAALTMKRAGPGEASITAWNASALTTAHPQPGTATEIDLTASYAYTIADTVATSAGYIAYLYPDHTKAQHLDGAHELFGVASLPTKYVTPSLGVYGEMVRLRGAYTTAGLSRAIAVRRFLFTPSASVGVAAYDHAPAHLNDVSAMFTAQWTFAEPAYLNARIAYSYMGGRAADLPYGNGSFTGRSAPWAMVAFGISR